jgi:hypothetical protein
MMIAELRSPMSPYPSRRDNPFATCWTKPGALPFRFDASQNIDQLVATLAAQNWRGQIIGPHGSGKSTLLATLKPALSAAGCHVHKIGLHDEMRLPLDAARGQRAVLVVDGFEQFSWITRRQLIRRCRRAGAGLIVTSHSPIGLPTLARLAPNRNIIEQLVADLCAMVPSGITRAHVAASHACHGSNVREIFFDLYDRHERMRRAI